MELLHCEHVTHFAVLVCLGTIKISTIYHGGTVKPIQTTGKSPQVTKVSLWRYISSQCVCVTCLIYTQSVQNAAKITILDIAEKRG